MTICRKPAQHKEKVRRNKSLQFRQQASVYPVAEPRKALFRPAALPLGPAPQEGDWFTRLQQTSAAK